MKTTAKGCVVLLTFLLAGCSGLKKEFQDWVVEDAEKDLNSEEKRKADTETKPSMVRPEGVQGERPKADKAVDAALLLHRKIYSSARGERVISAVEGDYGTVRIYLEAEGKRHRSILYWVARDKTDGLWRAYDELPLHESYPFVFKNVALSYLRGKHDGKIKITDLNPGTGEQERTIRIRFTEGGNIYVRALSLKRDGKRNWMVTKEADAKSVYD